MFLLNQIVYLNVGFCSVLGQEKEIRLLEDSLKKGQIPHSQVFIGKDGYGLLLIAISYALKVVGMSESFSSKEYTINDSIVHPDIHFFFPSSVNSKSKSRQEFLPLWYEFIKKGGYASINDWCEFAGIENKKPVIGVKESDEFIKRLGLKSFYGGWRCVIVWHAETMTSSASNKLLKIIEEPGEKTLFLLLTDNEKKILPTILSRCQKIKFRPLSDNKMASYIKSLGVEGVRASSIISYAKGNIGLANKLSFNSEFQESLELLFIEWVRLAFAAKKNKTIVLKLNSWSQKLASHNIEFQKSFISFSILFFRSALMTHYKIASDLIVPFSKFNIDSFSNFVHGQNVLLIISELEGGVYELMRNGNPKMIFNDLSFKLTRLLFKMKK